MRSLAGRLDVGTIVGAGAMRLPTLGGTGEYLPGRREPIQSTAEQTGHVHLRDADPRGYLCLRQILLEAQLQDRALSLGHRLEGVAKGLADLGQLVASLVACDRVSESPAGVPVAAQPGSVQ